MSYFLIIIYRLCLTKDNVFYWNIFLGLILAKENDES